MLGWRELFTKGVAVQHFCRIFLLCLHQINIVWLLNLVIFCLLPHQAGPPSFWLSAVLDVCENILSSPEIWNGALCLSSCIWRFQTSAALFWTALTNSGYWASTAMWPSWSTDRPSRPTALFWRPAACTSVTCSAEVPRRSLSCPRLWPHPASARFCRSATRAGWRWVPAISWWSCTPQATFRYRTS